MPRPAVPTRCDDPPLRPKYKFLITYIINPIHCVGLGAAVPDSAVFLGPLPIVSNDARDKLRACTETGANYMLRWT